MRKYLWEGIILIILGVVFLLQTFDVLPFDLWQEIWRLWPVFLIIPGFKLLLKKESDG